MLFIITFTRRLAAYVATTSVGWNDILNSGMFETDDDQLSDEI